MRKLTKREEKDLREKLARDGDTLAKYENQLRNERKVYGQFAQADSLTGRRARALAVGECVIRLMENLRDLNGKKKLLDGTLFWNIVEKRVRDTDGRKGFEYTVYWKVKSDEQAYTEEQIRKEIDETREKVLQETGEMFGIDVMEWYKEQEVIEEDLVPPFEPDPTEGGMKDE